MTGTLFLVPNALDLGTADTAAPLDDVLPRTALRTAARLGHWVCENAKSTRAFLKRVDAVVPLAMPLQAIDVVELPRAPKGVARPVLPDLRPLLAPARDGHDLGLLSEAGLPALADPGAALVAAAHAAGIRVVALPGASAIALAVAASGLDGQSFAFAGYVPVDDAGRAERLRALEAASRRDGQTQVMIETPYRNAALLDALLATLHPTTRLSLSVGLTLAEGWTRSDPVDAWRRRPQSIPVDVPAVFSLLAKR